MYPDQPQLSPEMASKRIAANSEAYDSAKWRPGWRGLEETGPEQYKRDQENRREIGTHEAVLDKMTVEEAEHLAQTPKYVHEISGDALARAKKGQTPKLNY